jgi:hypothetical protein
MYMKSLSVRQDKLLTQEAITGWFEYLHKHAPGDTVRALFVALSLCPFRSPLTNQKQCRYGLSLVRSISSIQYVRVDYTCDVLPRRLGGGRNK